MTQHGHSEAEGDGGVVDTIFHDAVLTVNGTYAGEVITVDIDDASAAFGTPMCIGADFGWDRTDADAAATMPCRGVALESGTGNKKVLLSGQICNTAWNWSNGDVYVSTAIGTFTQTAPTGSGDQVQAVGYALSADTIFFDPDGTVVEVA